MGIRIRHDAAAVALPANSANRKYGQQLVMQQQQQKYQGQQAGYDRLFQLGRDQQQNAFQIGRDNAQKDFVMVRDQQQNAFQMQRDQALGEQQLQQQQMEMRQKFMEDARKQSSGMIMDGIRNGEYDPVTARKLQQNLVNEAEALGNPQYDATQRAEALQKLRAERALLSANRLEKPPEPTAQEQFEKGVVVDPNTGMRYRQTAKGDYEPLEQPKKQPTNAREYYAENEDKFQKDLDATMTAMQSEVTAGTRKDPVTPEAAWKKMQEDYDFRQKALGRGQPTAAPQLPGAATAAVPGTNRSILEPTPAPALSGATPATPGTDRSILEVPRGAPPTPITAQQPDPGMPPSPAAPTADAAAHEAQMASQGYKLVTPPDGGQPYYYKDAGSPKEEVRLPTVSGQKNDEQMTEAGYKLVTPGGDRNPYYYKDSTPSAATPPVAPQNPWSEVATGKAQPAQTSTQAAAPVQAPDFGSLVSGAKNKADREFVTKIQGVYQGQSPDVQSAIGVLLSPSASDREAAEALMYLKSKGIDVEKLMQGSSTDNGMKGMENFSSSISTL